MKDPCTMKALSLHQPWASLIATGKKTIETRRYQTKYRGPVLICSTKAPKFAAHLCGYALAVAEIVECRPMTFADQEASCCKVYPWAWAWILKCVQPIKPFQILGRRRLFDLYLPEGYTEITL
ncbi:MAG: ASCH domain-containing protein [Planctomycetota bacterium]|mgnify:FL=1